MGLADKLGKVDLTKRVWTPRPELLLLPQVPKPLHGLAPRVVKGNIWWGQVRREAYRSTDRHCLACGVYQDKALFHRWMEGHEVYDTDYLLGRLTYVETVPLCHACHNFIHSGRLQAMLDAGEITKRKYAQIIAHGHAVLHKAGLHKAEPTAGPEADWADWRLVVDGKEYGPAFASFEEWQKHYAAKPKE